MTLRRRKLSMRGVSGGTVGVNETRNRPFHAKRLECGVPCPPAAFPPFSFLRRNRQGASHFLDTSSPVGLSRRNSARSGLFIEKRKPRNLLFFSGAARAHGQNRRNKFCCQPGMVWAITRPRR